MMTLSTTSDDSGGDFGENTSAFGIFDGDSSILSLGVDDTDHNLFSESMPMTTLDTASSSEDESQVGRLAASFSWPCTVNQVLVATAAVFQGLLIVVTLTAINKYGIFAGPASIDNDIEPAKYYEKADILQPERNAVDDYGSASGIPDSDRRSPKSTTTFDDLAALASVPSGLKRAAGTGPKANGSSHTWPSTIADSGNGSRALMCLFADTFEGDFPTHLCTHLVFMNAVIDLQAQIIRPNSAEQGRAVLQRFVNQRREQEEGGGCHFLVSLWEARVTDTYRDLFTDWSRGTRAATLALGWLQRTGLDGLALLNLALTSDSGPDFLNVLKVMRAVMGADVILAFGFYLPESYQGKEEKRLIRTLHQIANCSAYSGARAPQSFTSACRAGCACRSPWPRSASSCTWDPGTWAHAATTTTRRRPDSTAGTSGRCTSQMRPSATSPRCPPARSFNLCDSRPSTLSPR
ncbi:uncharacterized protein [Dermacentor albipictus]|uniref:uncharacterized protein isoform X5 n=1 Tax=Dermacentor albipictus TaxID=60249 RepID=UPI0031FD67E9